MRLTMLFCFTPLSRTLYFLLLYSTSTIRYCKTSYLGCFAIAETFSILKPIALSNVSQLRSALCSQKSYIYYIYVELPLAFFVTIFHVGTKKTAALVLDSVITVCVCVYTTFASWHFPVGWAEHVAVFLESWPVSGRLRVTVQPSWRPRGAAAFFLPPSAVFLLRAHNCLARPTAALEPKQTQCIKKKKSLKVEDLCKSCFTEDFSLHLSQTTASTLAPHNVKVCYARKYLILFFQKNTIMWKGKTLNIFSIYS